MSAFNFEWVEQYLHRDPALIIDAGCYDCADTIAFKLRWPGARVMAFEACPENYCHTLNRLAAMEDRPQIELFHAALCDRDGEIGFFSNADAKMPGGFGQSGSVLTPTPAIDNKWRGGMGHITFKPERLVPASRLDTFCAAHHLTEIDLLHMDVQGAESRVLDGLGSLRPALIFLEIDEVAETSGYLGAPRRAELLERLVSRGYGEKWRSEHDALYVRD